jgi:hypothetical protein
MTQMENLLFNAVAGFSRMLPRAQILLLNNELQWTFKIGV